MSEYDMNVGDKIAINERADIKIPNILAYMVSSIVKVYIIKFKRRQKIITKIDY